MFAITPGLPVRVTPDLRVEAEPGAKLTPSQGLALADQLIYAAVKLNRAQRCSQARRSRTKATA